MPATTWDPLAKGVSVTLSGSNLIATFNTGTPYGVAATRQITSAKTYYELVATTMSALVAIGLIDRSGSGTSGITFAMTNELGYDIHSVALRNNGQVLCNSVALATIQSFTQGDRIQIAYDLTVNPPQIYFNVNNGNWNNSGANNPATGVGGIALPSNFGANGSPAVPAVSCANSTPAAVITASFTTFTYTAPTGFVSPDTVGGVGYNADTNISGSARFTADGPARQDPVTGAAFRNAFPVAAGGWYGGSRLYPQWSPAAAAKTISGTVKENGAAVAGRTVRLFNKATGDFIAQTVSAPTTGAYSFQALNPALTYDVIAFDPGYNALILDNVSGV
jgi:hypothetical protein